MSEPNELDESFLLKMETIEPLLNSQPIPKELLHRQAQQAGRSIRTIQRWVKLYQEKGAAGLHSGGTCARHSPHHDWHDLIRKHYLTPRRLSIADVHGQCVQTAQRQGRRPPSYATVRRIVRQIPMSVASYHRNRREYRDKYQATGQLYEAKYPGELYLVDHCELDVLVLLKESSSSPAKRPYLTAVLDQYSRALVGYYLGFEPPSSHRVALSLRHAILPKNDPDWPMCGIPTWVRHDYGQDLMSKHIQQVRLDLGINRLSKEKGNPRANAELERFFGTVAAWERSLPGWTGASVRDRPTTVRPGLTLAKLDRLFRIFIRQYHHRRQATTGMPPADRWNTGLVPRLPETEAALDLLLLPVARPYKIRRDGIHFQTNRYWCDELLSWIGETVDVRFDPQRLDQIVIFIGKKRVGTAIRVAGERISYHVCRRRRSEQAARMRDPLSHPDETVTSGRTRAAVASNSEEIRRGLNPEPENGLLSVYQQDLKDHVENNKVEKIVLFQIPADGQKWC
jgi:putative transposase